MSPVASPSPNSRNQFIAPPNKGRILVNPQSPSSFQHPGRPVSTQLQRQQRMNQPFSPQGTPQSPHDLFPGSPSAENFARPGEDQQFLHSPQTPKAVQSPVHTPNSSNMSPVYSQPTQQQQQQPQNIRPIDNIGNYVQAPGTPRPTFNAGQIRTTVYARPDMFHNKPPFIQSPQSNQDQSNRQLRDLLQRTQAPPVATPSNVTTPPSFSMENDLMKNQAQNVQAANIIQTGQNNSGQVSDNTFRQPLPPPQMRQPRMQSMVGGQMIRSSSIVNPQRMIINPENRPRLGLRPGMIMNNTQQMITPDQQHQQQLQQQTQMEINQQRLGINANNNSFNNIQQDMNAQRQHGMALNAGQAVGMVQQQSAQNPQHPLQSNPMPQAASNEQAINQTPGDPEGIPDSVTAELEKLEQDENAGMEGVGDILGGLGDDDDDLLDSLTAEMGADFNILEYADPELDTTDEKSTLLDSLEMDESENKEEKLKHFEAEKMAKSNIPQNSMIPQAASVNRVQVQLANPNVPQTSTGIDPQNPNQNVQNIQQGAVPNQQIINPQQNNFQRQVRLKANQVIPPNQLPEIQQIHQQMMLQVCCLLILV
jgi:[histone H3]-lysine4 N-trimethyltransferase MLL3